jgi:hypothetical protein
MNRFGQMNVKIERIQGEQNLQQKVRILSGQNYGWIVMILNARNRSRRPYTLIQLGTNRALKAMNLSGRMIVMIEMILNERNPLWRAKIQVDITIEWKMKILDASSPQLIGQTLNVRNYVGTVRILNVSHLGHLGVLHAVYRPRLTRHFPIGQRYGEIMTIPSVRNLAQISSN